MQWRHTRIRTKSPRSKEISENEMASRREWFVHEMASLAPDQRRQFDPPTFSELVSERLDGGGRFIVPRVQRENWRKEAGSGGDLFGLVTGAERQILEMLESTPMTLGQIAGIRDGNEAAARSDLSYLMSIGVVQSENRRLNPQEIPGVTVFNFLKDERSQVPT